MKKKPQTITARVTFLEMQTRPQLSVPCPTRPRLALMRAANMPVPFYRYLYEQVGRRHHWYLRRRMPDDVLGGIVNSDRTRIDVLYADGCPAGFFELDSGGMPETVEIAYFGLCETYIGLGLGRWFLWSAIEAAWDIAPKRVCVHTNSLDHPAALSLYQKLGFEPVAIGEETVEPWN